MPHQNVTPHPALPPRSVAPSSSVASFADAVPNLAAAPTPGLPDDPFAFATTPDAGRVYLVDTRGFTRAIPFARTSDAAGFSQTTPAVVRLVGVAGVHRAEAGWASIDRVRVIGADVTVLTTNPRTVDAAGAAVFDDSADAPGIDLLGFPFLLASIVTSGVYGATAGAPTVTLRMHLLN